MRYELGVALAFLSPGVGNRKVGAPVLLSTLGIAIGVAFLVFTLSVYDGFVEKVETIIFSTYPPVSLQLRESQPTDIESEDDFADWDEWLEEETDDCARVCAGDTILEDRTSDPDRNMEAGAGARTAAFEAVRPAIERVPGVSQVWPVIFEEGLFRCRLVRDPTGPDERYQLSGPLRVLGVVPRGNDPWLPQIDRTITDPATFIAVGDGLQVVLSAELHRRFTGEEFSEKWRGAEVELVRVGSNLPATKLQLAGTFNLGMSGVSENMIVTSLATAQTIFDMEGRASLLGVSLADPYEADQVAGQIRAAVKDHEMGTFTVLSWLTVASELFNSLELYRKIIFVILGLSILITTLSIHNTLSIMTLQRRMQIGALSSMGMKQSSLRRVFLIIGLLEAVAGTTAGIILGWVSGYLFCRYLDATLSEFLPISGAMATIDVSTVMAIILFVSAVCSLTALLSARAALTLDPAECLRSE